MPTELMSMSPSKTPSGPGSQAKRPGRPRKTAAPSEAPAQLITDSQEDLGTIPIPEALRSIENVPT